MANNYYSQHPEKSHFSDAGLMIALAVCIVTIIKLLMYGFTYVSLAWLALTIVYVAISSATQAKSKVRTAATAAFMVISAVAFVAAFTFDYPIQPKTESNLRAEQDENKQNQQNVERAGIGETQLIESQLQLQPAQEYAESACAADVAGNLQ